MPFYCYVNVKPGDSPDHKHETVAEMRAAHSEAGREESDSKTRETVPGITLPASPTSPSAAVSVAPSPVATDTSRADRIRREERDWIDKQPWHDTKKEDARKFLVSQRWAIAEMQPNERIDWGTWSEQWDSVVAVDAYGREVTDPRFKMLKGMISMIPDGYYDAQADEGGHVDFFMISRPNRGQYKDHIKVSTQHSENWMPRLALMPNGRWLVLDRSKIDGLMLVVADHKTCAMRYAVELQHCWVCNTALTDDRSRHYLIGPVCDKKPQGAAWLEKVDYEFNDGLSYDQLVARGMPTRIWQESVSL